MASSVPGSVSMMTFLGAAGGVAPAAERAFSSARVAGVPRKAATARTIVTNTENAALRDSELRVATRASLLTPRERGENFASLHFANCGLIIGITSGRGPPSPKNGSRLSLGSRGVNTKLRASERFPQTANEFHNRTGLYEIWKEPSAAASERARSCYLRSELARQT